MPPTDVVERIHAALRERGATLAVAESLTGGLVGARMSAVAGASLTFRGGVIAYATQVKESLLGVDRALLDREGAVHREVAEQLATGVRRLLAATYGVALTGVAGPDWQDGKPPGTLHIAVAGPDGVVARSPEIAERNREGIRDAAADTALDLLLQVLSAPGREGGSGADC